MASDERDESTEFDHYRMRLADVRVLLRDRDAAWERVVRRVIELCCTAYGAQTDAALDAIVAHINAEAGEELLVRERLTAQ